MRGSRPVGILPEPLAEYQADGLDAGDVQAVRDADEPGGQAPGDAAAAVG